VRGMGVHDPLQWRLRGSTTADLLALRDWLEAHGVTHVQPSRSFSSWPRWLNTRCRSGFRFVVVSGRFPAWLSAAFPHVFRFARCGAHSPSSRGSAALPLVQGGRLHPLSQPPQRPKAAGPSAVPIGDVIRCPSYSWLEAARSRLRLEVSHPSLKSENLLAANNQLALAA
jgi:hypothetical protein